MQPSQLFPLLCLLTSSPSRAEVQQSVDATTVDAVHGEVFRLNLDSSFLSSPSDVRPSDEIRFSPSLQKGPDLPSWLTYDYGEQKRTGLVFGVPPPHVHQFQLEVIVTNLRTYDTSRREVLVNVSDRADYPEHEVQMKINNFNPVNLFFNSSFERLQEIFQEVLWPEAGGDLRLTWLEKAGSEQLTPLPGRRAGALLRLASSATFSPQLRHLQREVQPLWARVPCPRDFKRSSFERHFRRRDFVMDWCQFKLFEGGSVALPTVLPNATSPPPPTPPPPVPASGLLVLPSLASVPARSYTWDFLTTIGIPLLVALTLCATLTCIMCCQGEHLETDSDGEFFDNVFSVFVRRRPAHIQMVQYPPGGGSGRRSVLRDVSPRLADQSEFDSAQRQRSVLRDLSPRLTPYRDVTPGPSGGAASPDSGGFSQHQPPPYPSLSRRS